MTTSRRCTTRQAFNLFVTEFRGYGRSAGRPSVAHLVSDARPLAERFHATLDEQGFDERRFVMGRSLGSQPALEIAARAGDRFRGLIIESGAASIRRLLASRRPRGQRRGCDVGGPPRGEDPGHPLAGAADPRGTGRSRSPRPGGRTVRPSQRDRPHPRRHPRRRPQRSPLAWDTVRTSRRSDRWSPGLSRAVDGCGAGRSTHRTHP